MAALHVGSERLLVGVDVVSGVSHVRRLEESADFFPGASCTPGFTFLDDLSILWATWGHCRNGISGVLPKS